MDFRFSIADWELGRTTGTAEDAESAEGKKVRQNEQDGQDLNGAQRIAGPAPRTFVLFVAKKVSDLTTKVSFGLRIEEERRNRRGRRERRE